MAMDEQNSSRLSPRAQLALAVIGQTPWLLGTALLVTGYLTSGRLLALFGGGIYMYANSRTIKPSDGQQNNVTAVCAEADDVPISGSCSIGDEVSGHGTPTLFYSGFHNIKGQLAGFWCQWASGPNSSGDYQFKGQVAVACVKHGLIVHTINQTE
jgi:hypothetical protein